MNNNSNTPKPLTLEVRDNRVVIIVDRTRPVVVSPIVHIDTVNAIYDGLHNIDNDEVQALAEHLQSDCDESTYHPWCSIDDLDMDEIKMIRKALKGNTELARFNRAVKAELKI